LRVAPTGSCGHFNLNRDFVRQLCGGESNLFDFRTVPQADDHDPGKRPFAATVKEAKAVAQITGSFSLPWPSTVQRLPT